MSGKVGRWESTYGIFMTAHVPPFKYYKTSQPSCFCANVSNRKANSNHKTCNHKLVFFFFFKGHCWFWHKTHALSFKCTYLPWHVAFVTALTRQLGFRKKMRVSICTICSKADSASQYSMETKEKDYIVRDNLMFNFRRIYAFPFSGMPVLTLKQHN